MQQSDSNEIEDQIVIYEQSEVVWGKIRGYPWWPAYIDKVHEADDQQDIQYTVFFFGDNTHSRLDGSKLRKFYDYYAQFFSKAKTNRKLYLSIMKAEEKIKQNGGDIEFYQSMRNSMKKGRKHKGFTKLTSKLSLEDQANSLSEPKQLNRNNTYPNNNEKIRQKSEQQMSMSIQKQQPRRRGRKPRKQIIQKKQQTPQQSQKENNKQQKNESENSESSSSSEVPQKSNIYPTRFRRGKTEIIPNDNQKTPQQQQNQQSSSDEQNEQNKGRNYPLRGNTKTKIIARNVPKKRGRPKKIVEQINQDEQPFQSENENSQQIVEQQQQQKDKKVRVRPTGQNRKIRVTVEPAKPLKIKERTADKMEEEEKTEEKDHPNKELIIERVKFCLDKKEELIEYLEELNVTTNIVQEILDLEVSNVILTGEYTNQGIKVLEKLKSVLLFKYFPENIKHKKKYEKLSKRAQSVVTNTQQEESLQALSIRRKTILKLQKILLNIGQKTDQKQRSIQIQNYFRKSDESIGKQYKSIALRVLRALKDKSESIENILNKLDNGDYDEQK